MVTVKAESDSSAPFRQYLRDCQLLKRDVAAMLDGGETSRFHEIETIYAVDFSEIYAFSQPDITKSEVRLFYSESEYDANSLLGFHEHLLNNEFFGHSRQPLLLSPYAVELKRYSASIHDQEILNVLQAEQVIGKLRDSGVLANVLSDSAGRPSGALTTREVEQVLDVVEQHSPLLNLLLDPPLRSVERLKYLLRKVNFTDPEDLFPHPIEPDESIRARWREALLAHRDESRAFYCEMDALAIAQLVAMNRALIPQRKRIRLITRSQLMLRLFEGERGHDWDIADPHMLSHPRAFLCHPSRLATSTMGGQVIATLEHLRNSLEFVVTSGDRVLQDLAGSAGPTVADRRVPTELRLVRERWHLLTNLVLSADANPTFPAHRQSRSYAHAFAGAVLALVRSNSKVREEVQKRVDAIGQDLVRSQEDLPYSVQLSQKTLDNLDKRLDLERGAQATSLVPKSLRFVYYRRILFYTPNIRDTTRGNSKSVITRLLRQLQDSGSGNYERRLALAYLLAISDYWALSENYCLLALSTADDADGVPRHEVYYLLALCGRFHESSAERLRKSLAHLETAQKLRGQDDARYAAERAAVILQWRRDHARAGASDLPSLQEALDASHAALALLSEDDELRVPIYNNLCYALIETDPDTARHYYGSLEEILVRIAPRQNTWPPRVLHTIVVAELKLFAKPLAAKLRSLAQQVQLALASQTLTERDKTVLLEARRDLDAALQRASAS